MTNNINNDNRHADDDVDWDPHALARIRIRRYASCRDLLYALWTLQSASSSSGGRHRCRGILVDDLTTADDEDTTTLTQILGTYVSVYRQMTGLSPKHISSTEDVVGLLVVLVCLARMCVCVLHRHTQTPDPYCVSPADV